MRPFSQTSNPWVDVLQRPSFHQYPFLTSAKNDSSPGMENAIVIDPEALNVPWFSSFRMTLQSKHWKAAEEACRELIENIAQSKAKDKGILPQNLETFASPAARAKIDEVVDTSVSIVVNVWPRASEKRICLLAQGCVFLFLHDDVVECEAYSKMGDTILDEALKDLTLETLAKSPKWTNRIFAEYAEDIVKEEPELGLGVLKGILDFVDLTRTSPPTTTKFKSFRECLIYRMRDVGHPFVNAGDKFAGNFQLNDLELQPLAKLNELHAYHGTMANDLYSFSKEYRGAMQKGSALVNGANTLQELLGIAPASARKMLCVYLWDIEDQIHAEYTRLARDEVLSQKQLSYVRGMIECIAGNLFHMATRPRYAVQSLDC